MPDLVSTAPAIYEAFLKLVEEAAEGLSPQPAVFPFELGQYEPGSYITVHEIANHEWEWETIGAFTQKERYEVCGCATVYSGDSPATNKTLATAVMSETYSLFNTCVMTPLMSHRTVPLLGVTGVSPYLMLPYYGRYEAHPGSADGGQAGWCGVLNWSYHFEALVTPG